MTDDDLQTPDGRVGFSPPQEEGGVTYSFPVEIIVIGALTEDDHRAIEERVWTNFGEAFAYSA